jgi:hypothetical protein
VPHGVVALGSCRYAVEYLLLSAPAVLMMICVVQQFQVAKRERASIMRGLSVTVAVFFAFAVFAFP